MLKQLAVIYAMTSARVNICNTVGLVSCYQAHIGKEHWQAIKRILHTCWKQNSLYALDRKCLN